MIQLTDLQRLKTLTYPLLVLTAANAPIGETSLAAACQVDCRTARRWLIALTELGYLQRHARHNGYVLTARARTCIGTVLSDSWEKLPQSVQECPQPDQNHPEKDQGCSKPDHNLPEPDQECPHTGQILPISDQAIPASDQDILKSLHNLEEMVVQKMYQLLQNPLNSGPINTTTVKDSSSHCEEEQVLTAAAPANAAKPPPKDDSCPISPKVTAALRSAGIYEPKRSFLARQPWITPDHIRLWQAHLRSRGRDSTGLLIHCLQSGQPPPRHDSPPRQGSSPRHDSQPRHDPPASRRAPIRPVETPTPVLDRLIRACREGLDPAPSRPPGEFYWLSAKKPSSC
jgi:hypothetical protein